MELRRDPHTWQWTGIHPYDKRRTAWRICAGAWEWRYERYFKAGRDPEPCDEAELRHLETAYTAQLEEEVSKGAERFKALQDERNELLGALKGLVLACDLIAVEESKAYADAVSAATASVKRSNPFCRDPLTCTGRCKHDPVCNN